MQINERPRNAPNNSDAMFDYLRTISIEDITGKGQRDFSTSRFWGSAVAGELVVKLSTTHHIKLSHKVVLGGSSPEGGGTNLDKRPTATWINTENGEAKPVSESAAYRIHLAIGARIQDLREDTEHRLAILNADILREDIQPSWQRVKPMKGRQEFAATVGGSRVWLCHSVSSLFGFTWERYELIARHTCELFDAEARYSDDRARILFKKVSNRAHD